jgi:hypothetical protein
LSSHYPVPQFCERGIRLLCHLATQNLQVVFEVALPAARVGLRRTAAAAAPPLPEFLDKRATDTKARGNRALSLVASFQRLDDTVTKVLRIGFHTL